MFAMFVSEQGGQGEVAMFVKFVDEHGGQGGFTPWSHGRLVIETLVIRLRATVTMSALGLLSLLQANELRM